MKTTMTILGNSRTGIPQWKACLAAFVSLAVPLFAADKVLLSDGFEPGSGYSPGTVVNQPSSVDPANQWKRVFSVAERDASVDPAAVSTDSDNRSTIVSVEGKQALKLGGLRATVRKGFSPEDCAKMEEGGGEKITFRMRCKISLTEDMDKCFFVPLMLNSRETHTTALAITVQNGMVYATKPSDRPGGDGVRTTLRWPADTWVALEVRLDFKDQTYSVLLDSEEATQGPFPLVVPIPSPDQIETIYMAGASTNGDSNFILFDEIEILPSP